MAGSKLKIDIRRNKILRQLRAEGKVSVMQLSKVLGATPVTIRNDLTALERDGYLMRVQGGAVLMNTSGQDFPESVGADISCFEEKTAIAESVARRIQDGDTLFINSGTTTQCVADALRSRKNLNVVTNSLEVAVRLGGIPSIRVVLLGGEINSQYGFTYGGDTQEQLSRYQADWVILSVEGISAKSGITTHHAEEATIDRIMLSGAKQVLIAADHSKIGHVGFARVCACSERFTLVTDETDNDEALVQLEGCGMGIIRAQ